MKKLYMKVFSVLFVGVFIISSVCSTAIKVMAQNNKNVSYPFGYSDSDKFVADMLRATARNEKKEQLSVENYAYKITIRKYTYKIMAENLIDDKWLLGESVFWKNVGKSLSSEFVDLVTWKQVMYESLVMDWLKYQFESDEFKSGFTKETAKFNWKIISYISKEIDTNDMYSENGLGNMSVEKAQQLLDDDFYKINEDFAKNVKNITKFKEFATSGLDYIKRISEAMAVKQVCSEKIQFLRKVGEITKDEDLKKAISVVTKNFDASVRQVFFDESCEVLLEEILEKTIDSIVDTVTNGLTDASASLLAIKMGKAGLEWMFNQDKTSTARVELAILYIINQEFVDTYRKIRDDYENDTSGDKAVSFSDAYLNYTNYQAYASEKSKNYIAEALLEGAKNKVCNLFSNKNIRTYNDINEMLNGDIDISQKYYNLVGRFYDMYNNTLINMNNLEKSMVDNEEGPLNIPDDAVQYNGHYYYLYHNNEATDYIDAKSYCEEQGGYLATITSDKENKFLFNYIRKQGYQSAYFGLDGSTGTGMWLWNNGELFTYENWADNEPANSFDNYKYYVRFNDNTNNGTWKTDTFDSSTSGVNNVFLCEWGDYSVNGKDIIKTALKKRDVILTLDVSASMDGNPLEETKKATIKFIDEALNKNTNAGVVTYSSEAANLTSICSNKTFLKNSIEGLVSEDQTNIEAGLSRAYSMLQSGKAKKKIIVLMSDGQPNEGKEGEDLIKYAEKIKNQGVLIYTLGFFQNAGGYQAEGQYLMEKIASEGCHYEVESSEDLVFFFEDVAGQISGQKYIYVRIACPVDVSVTYDGQTLSSAESNQNLRTDFGTLSFEENDEEEKGEYSEETDNRVKVLRLKEGTDYDIRVKGTGDGEMDYTIGFMNDEGDYDDFRTFEDIEISKDTVIDTVANTSEKTLLNIDEDGDGKYDLKLQAGINGYGEKVKLDKRIYIIIAAAFFCSLFITFMVAKIKKRVG